jgi:hypothetical protein
MTKRTRNFFEGLAILLIAILGGMVVASLFGLIDPLWEIPQAILFVTVIFVLDGELHRTPSPRPEAAPAEMPVPHYRGSPTELDKWRVHATKVSHEPLWVFARRARDLFISALSPEEREEWQTYGFVTIQGSDRQIYRIKFGSVHNVDLLDAKATRIYGSLCGLPRDVPPYDILLGQYLHLKADAPGFRQIARWSPYPT